MRSHALVLSKGIVDCLRTGVVAIVILVAGVYLTESYGAIVTLFVPALIIGYFVNRVSAAGWVWIVLCIVSIAVGILAKNYDLAMLVAGSAFIAVVVLYLTRSTHVNAGSGAEK